MCFFQRDGSTSTRAFSRRLVNSSAHQRLEIIAVVTSDGPDVKFDQLVVVIENRRDHDFARDAAVEDLDLLRHDARRRRTARSLDNREELRTLVHDAVHREVTRPDASHGLVHKRDDITLVDFIQSLLEEHFRRSGRNRTPPTTVHEPP